MASTINATPTSSGLISSADNSGVLALQTGGTTAVTVDASQNVGIGGTPSNKLDVIGSTATTKIRSLATTGATYYLGQNDGGNLSVGVDNNTGSAVCGVAYAQYVWGSGYLTPLIFGCNNTERMRIDSSGNLLVGTTNSTGDGSGLELLPAANNGGFIGFKKSASSASGDRYTYFARNGSVIGSITQSGTTAVAYNTSSDYRLKENIAPMTGALATVSALKPVTYKWKSDNSFGQGFIAHELAEIVPDCVTGEKDAIDADGKPVYQGIDTSFLVATLTAAIQELNAKVEAQAAEIQALKGVK